MRRLPVPGQLSPAVCGRTPPRHPPVLTAVPVPSFVPQDSAVPLLSGCLGLPPFFGELSELSPWRPGAPFRRFPQGHQPPSPFPAEPFPKTARLLPSPGGPGASPGPRGSPDPSGTGAGGGAFPGVFLFCVLSVLAELSTVGHWERSQRVVWIVREGPAQAPQNRPGMAARAPALPPPSPASLQPFGDTAQIWSRATGLGRAVASVGPEQTVTSAWMGVGSGPEAMRATGWKPGRARRWLETVSLP